MATYLERAQEWVKDAPDLCAEQVESAIESMGFRLKDAQGLTGGQAQDIRDTLSYLNDQLKEMVSASDSGSGASGTNQQQGQPVEQSRAVNSQRGAVLDLSPLVPEAKGEPLELSTTEKSQAVNDLLASGLIQKGVSRTSHLQNL